MEQILQLLHVKTATSSPEQFLKSCFSPSSYSDEMRWGQGWPKQLYVLVIVKTWNFTERSFYKDLTYSSKVKHIKIYPDIMIKTSRLHHWVNIGDFVAIWNSFCLLRLILKTTTRITSQILKAFEKNICGGVFLSHCL